MKIPSMEDIKRYVSETTYPIAILPVGAVEAHGPHLPITTDSIIAEAIAEKVAEEVNAVAFPVVHYGTLWSTRGFPGSVWLETHLLEEVVYQIGRALKKSGFKMLVVVNSHVGNSGSLREALRRLLEEGMEVMLFNPDIIRKIASKYVESEFWHPDYFHAEEIETSLILYLKPDSVDMSKARAFYPEAQPTYFSNVFVPWEKITPPAVIGDPTKASREKGEKIFLEVCKTISDLIKARLADLEKNL